MISFTLRLSGIYIYIIIDFHLLSQNTKYWCQNNHQINRPPPLMVGVWDAWLNNGG